MRRNLKGFMGLSYVEVHGVPSVKIEGGYGFEAHVLKQAQRLVAQALVCNPAPIHGREVSFLRSVLGLTLKQFGQALGYSDVAILKWEREKSRRLDRVNEMAVKILVAVRLSLPIEGDAVMVAEDARSPKRLVVQFKDGKAAKAAA